MEHSFPGSINPIPGSTSLPICLSDIPQHDHDCLPVTHRIGCDSGNSLAEVCMQQRSTSFPQMAANAPRAYHTPARPKRQASPVLQNPVRIGSTDQLFLVPNPFHVFSQPWSCKNAHVGATEQLPDPVFKQQQWPLANSSLLTPLAGSSVVFSGSGDVKFNAQQHVNSLWPSSYTDVSCSLAQPRTGALYCTRPTGTLTRTAIPQRQAVQLPPVTSFHSRRQVHRRLAASPTGASAEAGASSPEVSPLTLLVLHVLLSHQQCRTCSRKQTTFQLSFPVPIALRSSALPLHNSNKLSSPLHSSAHAF